jgi:hypothetical protein
MPPVPTYDFPSSPILIIGFLGILVALAVLYTVNRAYFNSPFSDMSAVTEKKSSRSGRQRDMDAL